VLTNQTLAFYRYLSYASLSLFKKKLNIGVFGYIPAVAYRGFWIDKSVSGRKNVYNLT
jgi:hypothetical protein